MPTMSTADDLGRAANQRLVLSAIAKKNPVDIGHDGTWHPPSRRFPIRDYGSQISDITARADAALERHHIYSGYRASTGAVNDVWYEINNVDEWKK